MRQMGLSERLLAFLHGRGIFIVVHAIRLRGPLAERDLAHGLRALQARHPLLRVHLPREGADFVEIGTGPIELRTVPRADRDHWQRCFEQELATPLPYGDRPLMRVTWLRGRDGLEHDLVLKSSHAIVDGAAGATIYHDLMTACLRSIEGQARLEESLEVVPPLDDLLARTAAKPAKKPPFEIAKIMSIDRGAPARKRRSRALFRSLDPERAKRLAARAREHGVTINAVLCAAALAAARRVESDDRAFTLSTNVSLRDALGISIAAHHLGSYISSVSTTHRVEGDSELWALAGEVRAAIRKAVDDVEYSPPGRHKFGRFEKFVLGTLAPIWRSGRLQGLNVTNVGRIPHPTRYGPLACTGFYGASSQHVLGSSMQVAVHTLGETLFIVFVYAEPILSPERAARFVAAFDAELRRALGEEPADGAEAGAPGAATPSAASG